MCFWSVSLNGSPLGPNSMKTVVACSGSNNIGEVGEANTGRQNEQRMDGLGRWAAGADKFISKCSKTEDSIGKMLMKR